MMKPIDNVAIPRPGDIIIDVRHPEDAEQQPLPDTANQVLKMPFFNFGKTSSRLDKNQSYLLYCDKGIMSRLNADALCKQGFKKVGVYTPVTNP